MSGLWEAPAEGDWLKPTPGRDAVALSVAHKIILLVAIVAVITGLWALTSPRAQTQTDATLGPPMGTNTQLAVKHSNP